MSLWLGHRLGVTASVNLVGLFIRIFGSYLSGSCVLAHGHPEAWRDPGAWLPLER